MPAISYRSLLRTLIIIIAMLLFPFFATAQDTTLKEQAKIYREKGYAAQTNGDLDRAMSYYQKAIELDPVCAAAYNDLGVIYDVKGFKDRAEDSYLKCIKIDSNYQSAYFNLANLYEEKGELRKATGYWKKRIAIGDPNDPWTKKAKERLQNIGILVEDIGYELRQQEMADLIKNVSREKEYLESKTLAGIAEQKEKKEKAKRLFINARTNYSKGNYAAALKDAALAQSLDPSNDDINKFVDKIREKILGAYIQ